MTTKVSMEVRMVKAVLFGLFGWMLTTSAVAGAVIGVVAFAIGGDSAQKDAVHFSDENPSWGTGFTHDDPARFL